MARSMGVLFFCGILSLVPVGIWANNQVDYQSPEQLTLGFCLILVCPLSLAALWGLKEILLSQRKPSPPLRRETSKMSFWFGPAGWLWIIFTLTREDSGHP